LTPKPDEAIEDNLLFAELKAWRTNRAKKDRVAPYMVLHDTTLHELALRKPQTEQALMGVKGFGPMKVKNYGGELLNLLSKQKNQ